MERTCEWTGKASEGKFYLLPSTEGTEVVSEKALRSRGDDSRLREQLKDLQQRIELLEGQAGTTPAVPPEPEPEESGQDNEPAKAGAAAATKKAAAPRSGK